MLRAPALHLKPDQAAKQHKQQEPRSAHAFISQHEQHNINTLRSPTAVHLHQVPDSLSTTCPPPVFASCASLSNSAGGSSSVQPDSTTSSAADLHQHQASNTQQQQQQQLD
jgi:hypothetical protein